MADRTDVHKPSAIIPTDYTYIAEDCMKVQGLGDALCMKAQREIIAAHRKATGATYAQVDTTGNCMVCGSVNAIYTSLFYHTKSNTYVRMGHDCADKCDMSGSFERNLFRKALQDVREAQAGKRKAQALLGDAGLTAAWDLYAMEYMSIPSLIVRKDAETGEVLVTTLPYEEQTIRDIVGNLVKYGSFRSDKQKELVRTLVERIPGRDQRNAEYAAKRAAEKEAAKPAPTGRIKVEGMVLKVEEKENDFGVRTVMTVRTDEGWIAWGSVPSGVTVEKDCRVVFVATVTPSDRDPKFAWYKRPKLYVSPEERKEAKREAARLLAERKQEGTKAPDSEE